STTTISSYRSEMGATGSLLVIEVLYPKPWSPQMRRTLCLLAFVVSVGIPTQAWSQEKKQGGDKKVADGVYAVLRESLQEKDLLPLKPGERLLTDTHPYLKKDEIEAPHFLV